jgi:membrane protein DedA with SNARE-associated domain
MLVAAGFIDSFLTQFGYAAVFGFVGIESLGIPFPGETMLIAAALYAGATHNLNIAGVVIAAAAGAIIGDNIGFGVGHWGGYRLLLRYGRYIRLHEGRVKLARYLFQRHGGKVVFFGRFVSVLRTYAAFLAGTARMPWPRFLAFNASGGIIWATLYGVGAYLAGDRVNKLSRPVDFALAGVAVLVIVGLILLLRRKEAELTAQAELAFPGPLQHP